MQTKISRGLVIRQPWVDHILRGEKRWELRSRSTTIRGPIALIQSGTGLVVGTASLDDVLGPLLPGQFERATEKGHVVGTELQAVAYPKLYAWVLSGARPLPHPLPYDHPQGAVIWVRLSDAVLDGLRSGVVERRWGGPASHSMGG